jgi:CDP-diacylglycerol--glycerol-3-phosphate 3-phosphatidyltransferase
VWLAAAMGGPVALVAAAAAAATLPTFASLAAAGAGATRRNGGPVGKTERCALVVVATAWPAALAVVCGVVVVGSLATAVVRLVAAHRELAR